MNPARSRRSRVVPKRTLSLSAFSARLVNIFNALGAILTKLRCNSSVISSEYCLRSLTGQVAQSMRVSLVSSLLCCFQMISRAYVHTPQRIPVFD